MKKQDHWTAFWKQGHTTTFGDFFKEGYRGAIGQWLVDQQAQWPKTGTLLDIGCGNCGLLTGLLASNSRLDYIGLDPAEIAINEHASSFLMTRSNNVSLVTGRGAEETGLAGDAVDVAVSVFGFEYSDTNAAAEELARVLKPRAPFSFLLHHSDSVVTRMSGRALAEYQEEDVKAVVAALHTISERAERVALAELKNDTAAEVARLQLNDLASRYLGQRSPDDTNVTMFEFMTSALRFFQIVKQPLQERLAFISDLQMEYDHYCARFRQMISVAADETAVHQLLEYFVKLGFEVKAPQALMDERGLLAWEISGRKLAG
jgi:SAM-dependent methyltransferase